VVGGDDRGMMTSANVKRLRSRAQGYILGRQRRRSEEVYRYVDQATHQGPLDRMLGGHHGS
tara:strand:+ start:352 stop:534 length:183 start_codon:yes stop_codon:yes gene_type:complete